MALDPVATSADLDRFGYDSTVVTNAHLDRASVRARAYTRQTFNRVIDDTAILPVRYGEVSLDQRPAEEPTQIVDMAGDELTDWVFNPATATVYGIDLGGWGPDPLGLSEGDVPTVAVTYTHGYTTYPDELVETVCSIASRLAHSPSGTDTGVRSRAIDDWRVTYATEATTTAGGLLPGEKKALDALLGPRHVASVTLE